MKKLREYETVDEFCKDFEKKFHKKATFDDFFGNGRWTGEGVYKPIGTLPSNDFIEGWNKAITAVGNSLYNLKRQ